MASDPTVRRLEDPAELRVLLERDPDLHLYALADLDPLLWPRTAWYGGAGEVVLGWFGVDPPCFVAMTRRPRRMGALLSRLGEALPPRMYLHTAPGCETALQDLYELERTGGSLRMMLRAEPPAAAAGFLEPGHLGELEALYREAYPDGWFDPRTLATGRYAGLWRGGRLVSVAGVHAWSPGMGVAALGNIATHPDWRGRGLARTCTAALCRRLRQDGIARIGLNVDRENGAALRCYEALGFRAALGFEEWTAVRRS